jgi:hypothetical protein
MFGSEHGVCWFVFTDGMICKRQKQSPCQLFKLRYTQRQTPRLTNNRQNETA